MSRHSQLFVIIIISFHVDLPSVGSHLYDYHLVSIFLNSTMLYTSCHFWAKASLHSACLYVLIGSRDLFLWYLYEDYNTVHGNHNLSNSILYLNLRYQCLRPLSHHGWITFCDYIAIVIVTNNFFNLLINSSRRLI